MPYDLAIPGWMPEAELQTIEAIARCVPVSTSIVEVGSFCGRSSYCWARSVLPSVVVNCVDMWNPQAHPYTPPARRQQPPGDDYGVAESDYSAVGSIENFRMYTAACHNIITHQGRSPQGFSNWRRKFIVVFLDATHHNPDFRDDLLFWHRWLMPNGLLCGDDCARTHPDVLWTVHDFCKEMGRTFVVKGRIWGILPCQRSSMWISAFTADRRR